MKNEKRGTSINELFTNSPCVYSNRILYTPSSFAKLNLMFLQEAGRLTALAPHTSTRENLRSFLCFVVQDGEGSLEYEGKTYELKTGDCVFIDCRKRYSHSTGNIIIKNNINNKGNTDRNNTGINRNIMNSTGSDNNQSNEIEEIKEINENSKLWSLVWCHFYGSALSSVYDKYKERGGRPVFHLNQTSEITEMLNQVFEIAGSSDYIRDMKINTLLCQLLEHLMVYSWNPENVTRSKKRLELDAVKSYLDMHYMEKITLEALADQYFIDKFYLSKIFKERYGMTVISYVEEKRITEVKRLLRFSSMNIEEISGVTGYGDANYLSRRFKKIEGMTPGEYRRKWQGRG